MTLAARKVKSRLHAPTRFVYVMLRAHKLQTFELIRHGNDWREMHQRATSALAGWMQLYPADELSLWATDQDWPR